MHLGKAIQDRDLTTLGVAATAAALPYVTYGAIKGAQKTARFAKDTDKLIGNKIQEKYTGVSYFSTKDLVERANKNINRSYGINRSGYDIVLQPSNDPLWPGELNVFLGENKTHSGRINLDLPYTNSMSASYMLKRPKKAKQILEKRKEYFERSPRNRAVIRDEDFPFGELTRASSWNAEAAEMLKEVKGKGVSGEISKALNDAAKSYGSVLESSDAHLSSGLLRYLIQLKKGNVALPTGHVSYKNNEDFLKELESVMQDQGKSAAFENALKHKDVNMLPLKFRQKASQAMFRYKKLGGSI